MTELKEDNLENYINDDKVVFVQYMATWCGNCKLMKPKFKKFSSEKPNNFYIIDAEKYPNSRRFANVNNLPTFAAFKNGQLVNQVQTNKADVLKNFIDEAANY